MDPNNPPDAGCDDPNRDDPPPPELDLNSPWPEEVVADVVAGVEDPKRDPPEGC